MRFVLWAGKRKTAYIAGYGAITAFAALLWFAFFPALRGLPAFYVIGIAFLGGVAVGWFFWHLFVWPMYAAYPGSTILPPHVRVYDEAKTTGASHDRDVT